MIYRFDIDPLFDIDLFCLDVASSHKTWGLGNGGVRWVFVLKMWKWKDIKLYGSTYFSLRIRTPK